MTYVEAHTQPFCEAARCIEAADLEAMGSAEIPAYARIHTVSSLHHTHYAPAAALRSCNGQLPAQRAVSMKKLARTHMHILTAHCTVRILHLQLRWGAAMGSCQPWGSGGAACCAVCHSAAGSDTAQQASRCVTAHLRVRPATWACWPTKRAGLPTTVSSESLAAYGLWSQGCLAKPCLATELPRGFQW